MKYYLGFLLIFITTLSFSQERCGFSVGNKLRQLKNPNLIKQQSTFEYQLRQVQENLKEGNARITEKVYRIPVVVHVVHSNQSSFIGGENNTNISDEQIKTQIRVLNEDYRRRITTNGFNINPVGADMEIEFELALKDPKGNASTGITRTYNPKESFDLQFDGAVLSNIIQWNYEKYLNIWVAKSRNGTIGYSEFPYDSNLIGLGSTPDDVAGQQIFDGVIIDYQNFGTCCGKLRGSYNLGRTTTHEVGHWLGLLHPNGDETCGNDYCNDTPRIEKMNDGTTCNKLTSNCGGVVRANMIENYMDYSPDRCMNVFTNDQKNRTRAALQLSLRRKKLLLNITQLAETENLSVSIEPNPVTAVSNVIVLFKGEKNVKIEVYDLRGVLMYEDNFESQKSNVYAIKTNKLPTGSYVLRVTAGDETSSKRVIVDK
jgi:hypothetical protein